MKDAGANESREMGIRGKESQVGSAFPQRSAESDQAMVVDALLDESRV